MCEHCGCRGVEPIAALLDDHLELHDMSGRIRRAIAADSPDDVADGLRRLAELLQPHVEEEESGLFAALKADGEFAEHVTELEHDHAALDVALASIDLGEPGWGERLTGLLDELARHMDKEDLGTFPVAVVTLGDEGWKLVNEARTKRLAATVG
ncbi:MAG TPA: hemerythrin domain-containing protein [Kribbella sp.]|nr:hemerythrin domain-containing protein [Kribbella sp.]